MAETEETPKPAGDSGSGSAQGQAGVEANKDARTFAMLAHLLAIFTCFLGPLIIWLVKKDEHSFVDEQGKEALNFQITILIVYVVAGFLPIIGCFLAPAAWVVNLIFCIMGCTAANKGEHYRYPVSLRFIK